jgi:hypothetical protein
MKQQWRKQQHCISLTVLKTIGASLQTHASHPAVCCCWQSHTRAVATSCSALLCLNTPPPAPHDAPRPPAYQPMSTIPCTPPPVPTMPRTHLLLGITSLTIPLPYAVPPPCRPLPPSPTLPTKAHAPPPHPPLPTNPPPPHPKGVPPGLTCCQEPPAYQAPDLQ